MVAKNFPKTFSVKFPGISQIFFSAKKLQHTIYSHTSYLSERKPNRMQPIRKPIM